MSLALARGGLTLVVALTSGTDLVEQVGQEFIHRVTDRTEQTTLAAGVVAGLDRPLHTPMRLTLGEGASDLLVQLVERLADSAGRFVTGNLGHDPGRGIAEAAQHLLQVIVGVLLLLGLRTAGLVHRRLLSGARTRHPEVPQQVGHKLLGPLTDPPGQLLAPVAAHAGLTHAALGGVLGSAAPFTGTTRKQLVEHPIQRLLGLLGRIVAGDLADQAGGGVHEVAQRVFHARRLLLLLLLGLTLLLLAGGLGLGHERVVVKALPVARVVGERATVLGFAAVATVDAVHQVRRELLGPVRDGPGQILAGTALLGTAAQLGTAAVALPAGEQLLEQRAQRLLGLLAGLLTRHLGHDPGGGVHEVAQRVLQRRRLRLGLLLGLARTAGRTVRAPVRPAVGVAADTEQLEQVADEGVGQLPDRLARVLLLARLPRTLLALAVARRAGDAQLAEQVGQEVVDRLAERLAQAILLAAVARLLRSLARGGVAVRAIAEPEQLEQVGDEAVGQLADPGGQLLLVGAIVPAAAGVLVG
ncbi:hypothetical protein GCM10023321_50700 [Pseudonocardia eucalypti]|uniref:Secreted protein n=1 Tax=Pseudonocardia eucalypti TaxID=648755 RepID=A0ABP9QKM0_9PSEU